MRNVKIKTMCKEVINGREIPRKLIFDGKTLVIQTPCSKTPDEVIPREAISECEHGAKTELIKKSKSVIGRALIGSVFGATGAIIGGMSGIGEKTEKEKTYYLIVEYKESGEIKHRIFEDYPTSKTYKIAKAFKKER